MPFDDLLSAAINFASSGLSIFPCYEVLPNGSCSCAKTECEHPGKHPRTTHGFFDATTDSKKVTQWWSKWHLANIGCATGASGLVVVDVDPKNGGDATWDCLREQYGDEITETITVHTPSGGFHYHFRVPTGAPINGGTHKLGRGVDVQAVGQYVILPPSNHKQGRYAFAEGLSYDDRAPAPLPNSLLQLINASRLSERSQPSSKSPVTIPVGTRNDHLTSLAGSMRLRGMSSEAILAALLETNTERCDPPLSEDEVRQIADSVAGYSPDFPLTDVGNSQRLISRHPDIRFVTPLKVWFVWDGTRWAQDSKGEVFVRAQSTVETIIAEAAGQTDQKRRDDLLKWAQSSQSEARIRSMVRLAEHSPHAATSSDELDVNLFLLNCQNGTVDLLTGELRPHSRHDLMTKVVPVAYDPNATLPLWDEFLDQTTGGNADLKAFLQRAVGYSITGDTREEKLFFIHGKTRTGKSSFVEAIKSSLGDYAVTADFDTFLAHRNGSLRNDIARMAGARLVASIEVNDGTRFSEGLVKQLTGGDKVVARFLYHEHFEFVPKAKLWLVANNAPSVRDDDDAFWVRILRVPFEVQVSRDRVDPSVKAILRNPLIAGPAILAWAVAGCLAWQREGLGIPPIIEHATDQYRQEMDLLQPFLDDFCLLERSAWVSSKDLFEAYSRWARASGERPMTSKMIGERLRARGCVPEKRNGVRGWREIGLMDFTRATEDGK